MQSAWILAPSFLVLLLILLLDEQGRPGWTAFVVVGLVGLEPTDPLVVDPCVLPFSTSIEEPDVRGDE